MKPILFIAFLLAANIYYAQNSYKKIYGQLTSKTDYTPIPFTEVRALSDSHSTFTQTDVNGTFSFDSLPDGNYSIKFSYDYTFLYYPDTIRIDNESPNNYFMNATMILPETKRQVEEPVLCICRSYDWYRTPANPSMTYQEIQKSVNKYQLPDLIQGTSSNVLRDENELSLNGARKSDYLFLIDGIKCREICQVPSATMKSVTVMSHFIPAKYGDTTGGVILIETMSYMDLYNERERQGLVFRN